MTSNIDPHYERISLKAECEKIKTENAALLRANKQAIAALRTHATFFSHEGYVGEWEQVIELLDSISQPPGLVEDDAMEDLLP